MRSLIICVGALGIWHRKGEDRHLNLGEADMDEAVVASDVSDSTESNTKMEEVD
jgi:hypothetical protein